MRATLLLLALALTSSLLLTEASHHHHHSQLHTDHVEPRMPLFIGGRPWFGFTGQHLHEGKQQSKDVVLDSTAVEKNFSAIVDHFNATYKYWNQRYFVNTQYDTGKSINFLYVEGEGVANSSKITDETYPHVALAKSQGATLYMLEHRFYGKSRPFKRMYNKNLLYLTTQQAVEDIADFINRTNNGATNAKWVVWGASYAGALTLWFRQKYPTLSVGVVASSPQTIPVADYYTFELNVANALNNNSFHCNEGTRFAARAVREELQYVEGIQRLNDELQLLPPINVSGEDYKTHQYLHTQLMPLIQLPVLYNHVNIGPFANSVGVDDLCNVMKNESIANIEKIYTWTGILWTAIIGPQDAGGNWSIPTRYLSAIAAMQESKYDEDNLAKASSRAWLYQACHEFGGFTSTDNGRNIFGDRVPNSYYIALCSDVFGGDIHIQNYTIDDLNANIKKLQGQFDTTNVFKGTNAVITGGGHDPWLTLQVNATSDPSAVYHFSPDIGHAADLQPPTYSDSVELTQARHLIEKNVKAWITGGSTSNNIARVPANRVEALKQQDEIVDDSPSAKPHSLVSHFVERDSSMPSRPNPSTEKVEAAKASRMGPLNAHMRLKQMQRMYTQRQMSNYEAATQDSALNHTSKHYLWTGFVVQPVDHFNAADNRTWRQRYYTNNKYQETHHSPQFLMLGGESEIMFEYVSGEFLQYIQWAKDFNAMLHALEHRFYGESQPFAYDISVPSLQYLTVEQVLGDVATYISTTNVQKNLTVNRWIVFGGSYAGSLAAAFRVRYPDLSIGAIASSAPIQAIPDFYAYMQDVQSAVDQYGIYGCGEGIRKFFYELKRLFNTRDGRLVVKMDFCVWNDWYVENYIDEKDKEYFLADLVMWIDGVVQYDDEDHWWLQYVCEYFRDFDGFATTESKTLIVALKTLGTSDPSQWPKTKEEREKFASEVTAEGSRAPPAKKTVSLKGKNMKSDPFTRTINAATVKPDDGGSYDNYDDESQKSKSDNGNYEGSNWSGSSSITGDEDESLECYCWGCEYVSYDETLWLIQDNTYWEGNWWLQMWGEQRLWMWSTCTEWGYQISTDYGRNIMEDSLPINFLIDYCPDVFGDDYNRTRLDNGVRNTNYLYGGQDNYNGTNVVWVNGSEDPWHMLSVYYPDHPPVGTNNTILFIPGTSHCQDMNKWEPGDKDVVKVAHKKIKAKLVDWVEGSKPPTN